MLILPTRKEAKIGSKEPEFRANLSLQLPLDLTPERLYIQIFQEDV